MLDRRPWHVESAHFTCSLSHLRVGDRNKLLSDEVVKNIGCILFADCAIYDV